MIRTTRKLFGPRGHDKLIWAVNLLLMLAMVMRVVSGIVISEVARPSMGINPQIGPSWQRLHILTAEITLGLVRPSDCAAAWRTSRRTQGSAGRQGRPRARFSLGFTSMFDSVNCPYLRHTAAVVLDVIRRKWRRTRLGRQFRHDRQPRRGQESSPDPQL